MTKMINSDPRQSLANLFSRYEGNSQTFRIWIFPNNFLSVKCRVLQQEHLFLRGLKSRLQLTTVAIPVIFFRILGVPERKFRTYL